MYGVWSQIVVLPEEVFLTHWALYLALIYLLDKQIKWTIEPHAYGVCAVRATQVKKKRKKKIIVHNHQLMEQQWKDQPQQRKSWCVCVKQQQQQQKI